MSIVYLNGEFLPMAEARVPVLDRGFIFGDGVYEVVPAFEGLMFRLDEHLARLERSLAGVRIANPMSREAWKAMLRELLRRNPHDGDRSVYLQVTRGVSKRDHVLSAPVAPTVFAMANPANRKGREPVTAIVREDIRWKWCEIKAIALLPNILLRMQAQDAGAYEAILIRDGHLTEGAASNVFVVAGGVIKTPPHAPNLLPGITRDLIVELLAGHGIAHAETAVTEHELRAADEVWISGSVRELAPVVSLDGRPVGAGRPGPVWERVVALYETFRDDRIAEWRRGTCG
jgi:D-alanine transaminase